MLRPSSKRRAARRRKRFFACLLCTASFVTGHMLFGQDPAEPTAPAAPSLLSQYLQTKTQLVQAQPIGREATAKSEKLPTTLLQLPDKSPAGRRNLQPAEPTTELIKAADFTSVASKPISAQSATESGSMSKSAASADASNAVKSPSRISELLSYRPTADSAAGDVATEKASQPTMIEAQPLPQQSEVQPAVAIVKLGQYAGATKASGVFVAPEDSPVSSSAATDEENLPPIVSPSSVPRPRAKKQQTAVPPAALPLAAQPLEAKPLEPNPLGPKPLDARPIVMNAGGSAIGIDLTKVVPASFPMMITNPHLPHATSPAPLRIELGGNQTTPAQP